MSCLRENLLAESASVILPPELEQVVAALPKYVDRRGGADLITKHMFPVSFRTLEAWPLPTRHVNGHAIVPTAKLFEIAFAKLSAAPVLMGGRRSAVEQRTA
jgi:hypothetical protein